MSAKNKSQQLGAAGWHENASFWDLPIRPNQPERKDPKSFHVAGQGNGAATTNTAVLHI